MRGQIAVLVGGIVGVSVRGWWALVWRVVGCLVGGCDLCTHGPSDQVKTWEKPQDFTWDSGDASLPMFLGVSFACFGGLSQAEWMDIL